MEIANTRLEQQLTYGASVKRVKYALAPIRVRNITIGQNRTIDQLNDSGETLLVNKNKGSDFRISRKEMVQAGPLNPAESIGSEVAKKLSRYIDADVFAEVKNALQTFDTGDLTTMASSGTPITLSTTNVPQLLAQGRAKLRRGNQDLTSLAIVLDSYGGSVIEQYVMSKNIDLAGAAFQNGYAGPVGGAELYLSENLLAEAVITMASNPTNGQTFSVNGFVYTFVSSLGSTPGNVLIDTGTGVDVTRDNLIDALLQDAATAGVKYVAWTDVDPNYDQSNWVDLQIAQSTTTRLTRSRSLELAQVVSHSAERQPTPSPRTSFTPTTVRRVRSTWSSKTSPRWKWSTIRTSVRRSSAPMRSTASRRSPTEDLNSSTYIFSLKASLTRDSLGLSARRRANPASGS